MPASRQGLVATTIASGDDARFAVEAKDVQPSTFVEVQISPRERELTRKLHDLLASPLGEGIALILEESHRMLPLVRPTI